MGKEQEKQKRKSVDQDNVTLINEGERKKKRNHAKASCKLIDVSSNGYLGRQNSPSFLLLSTMSYGIEYPFS